MPRARLIPARLILALTLSLLAACQLSLPGRKDAATAAPPASAGSITTTTLDAPAAPAPPAAQPAAADPGTDTASTPPAPPGAKGTDALSEAEPPPPPAASAPPKSAGQIACEKDRGTWARAGEGGGMACIRQTRDGGKRCDSKSDCQGECLARSRSCAPIQPLFGCNDVLMDNGAAVTLCID